LDSPHSEWSGGQLAWSADQATGRSEVAVMSGGIGDEDEARLMARQNEFNLKVLFTINEGNYHPRT
jgi:hypothetical protein